MRMLNGVLRLENIKALGLSAHISIVLGLRAWLFGVLLAGAGKFAGAASGHFAEVPQGEMSAAALNPIRRSRTTAYRRPASCSPRSTTFSPAPPNSGRSRDRQPPDYVIRQWEKREKTAKASPPLDSALAIVADAPVVGSGETGRHRRHLILATRSRACERRVVPGRWSPGVRRKHQLHRCQHRDLKPHQSQRRGHRKTNRRSAAAKAGNLQISDTC
jgi:hypothetical protein